MLPRSDIQKPDIPRRVEPLLQKRPCRF